MRSAAPQSRAVTEQDKPPLADAIRVMILDDSLVVRSALRRAIEDASGMSIVATASSGEQAISQLATVQVDVILLDLEMPGMGGLEALPRIIREGSGARVLIVSSLTSEGAEATLTALSMGAADTLLKPVTGGFDDAYRADLLARIRALGGKEHRPAPAKLPVQSMRPARLSAKRPRIVAIGASTGGIHALCLLLKALPRNFDLPIAVTQHLPTSFLPVFARQLELASARKASIASDGSVAKAGEILIAPGEGHMMFTRRGEQIIARISDFPTPSGCRPSVDPMFESLAEQLDGCAIGVVLSGMGKDGAEGAALLAQLGGTVMAQDAESCSVWGMPRAVTTSGIASVVAPPAVLAARIAAGIAA